MAKRWKTEEITYMKRYGSKRTTAELAERFKTEAEQVTAKLSELGLASKDSVAVIRLEHDPLVKVYVAGTKAMYQKKWHEAVKHFKQVLAETDQMELRSGAEKYLQVCEEHLGSSAKKAEDPFLEAVYERNRGNLEQALDLCTRGGRAGRDERFAYLAAAIHAATDDFAKAAELLSSAIEMEPKNRVHACYDSDFAAMRGDGEYAGIFEAS
jgi:tetratricopeptide (TPR) repeat protein